MQYVGIDNSGRSCGKIHSAAGQIIFYAAAFHIENFNFIMPVPRNETVAKIAEINRFHYIRKILRYQKQFLFVDIFILHQFIGFFHIHHPKFFQTKIIVILAFQAK